MRTTWKLIKEGFVAFYDDNALSKGAAIAFYLITALAPLIFITMLIAGLGFGPDAVQAAIRYQLRSVMSLENAQALAEALHNANSLTGGLWSGALGLLTLLITASGVFGEMEDALNCIWKAPQKGSLLMRLARGRIRGMGLVVGLGFLFLISMLLTTAITALSHYIDIHTPISQLVLRLLNFGISLVIISVVVAAIYKILPNKKLEWRDVMLGAIGTALLFLLGQGALGLYLAQMRFEVPYGAAGGLIVLLIWAYYSAQVFLLGAEFTKVWANHYGSQQHEITPDSIGAHRHYPA